MLNHRRVAGARDLFGQLWKEYSLADSRYLTSDTFLVCMESVTAVCQIHCFIQQILKSSISIGLTLPLFPYDNSSAGALLDSS